MDKTFIILSAGAVLGVWAKNKANLDNESTMGASDVMVNLPAFGPKHTTQMNPGGLSASIYLIPAALALAVWKLA